MRSGKKVSDICEEEIIDIFQGRVGVHSKGAIGIGEDTGTVSCRPAKEEGEDSIRSVVSIGIGDDAAAFACISGMEMLLSTDILVDGVHFKSGVTPFEAVGYKALVSNLSDIAAMGARGGYFLLSLGLPPDFYLDDLLYFADGIFAAAKEYNVELIGGNVSRSPVMFVNVTMSGFERLTNIVKRDGAKDGDLIFVTGTLGDSAAGLYLLQNQVKNPDHYLVNRHLKPTARMREGHYLAKKGLPSAMIDISDGIVKDLDRICRKSGVGAYIDTSLLPISKNLAALSDKIDPVKMAMCGGEDYELLFTIPPSKTYNLKDIDATLIGVIIPGDSFVWSGGRGFEHFSPRI